MYLTRKNLYEEDYKILLKGSKTLNKQKEMPLRSMENVLKPIKSND